MSRIILGLCLISNFIKDIFGSENASVISNFCTIILFLLFVIGKIWILLRNKNLYNENFKYKVLKKRKEYNRQFLLGKQDIIAISSPDGIYDINIFSIKRNKNAKICKRIKIPAKMEDGIQHPLKLNKNEKVYVKTDLPCGMPNYQIEIVKYDYVKIVAELGINGKEGGFELNNVKIKHGIRSFLYYLCK